MEKGLGKVKYGGSEWIIGAILFLGERYFMLIDKYGSVALVPEIACETLNHSPTDKT